jgi:hypothetical protein
MRVVVGQLKENDMNLQNFSVKFIVEAAKYGKYRFEPRGAVI